MAMTAGTTSVYQELQEHHSLPVLQIDVNTMFFVGIYQVVYISTYVRGTFEVSAFIRSIRHSLKHSLIHYQPSVVGKSHQHSIKSLAYIIAYATYPMS